MNPARRNRCPHGSAGAEPLPPPAPSSAVYGITGLGRRVLRLLEESGALAPAPGDADRHEGPLEP